MCLQGTSSDDILEGIVRVLHMETLQEPGNYRSAAEEGSVTLSTPHHTITFSSTLSLLCPSQSQTNLAIIFLVMPHSSLPPLQGLYLLVRTPPTFPPFHVFILCKPHPSPCHASYTHTHTPTHISSIKDTQDLYLETCLLQDCLLMQLVSQ